MLLLFFFAEVETSYKKRTTSFLMSFQNFKAKQSGCFWGRSPESFLTSSVVFFSIFKFGDKTTKLVKQNKSYEKRRDTWFFYREKKTQKSSFFVETFPDIVWTDFQFDLFENCQHKGITTPFFFLSRGSRRVQVKNCCFWTSDERQGKKLLFLLQITSFF